jgi:hypothetical protein
LQTALGVKLSVCSFHSDGDDLLATKFDKVFQALSEPFSPDQIKYRPIFSKGQRAMDAAYVDARSYENRLDLVLGPENWWTSFEIHERGVICKFTMQLDQSTVVQKSGFGEYTAVASWKGASTDAFKRAVSHATGLGRHLYDQGIVDYEAGGIWYEDDQNQQQGPPPSRHEYAENQKSSHSPAPSSSSPQSRSAQSGNDRHPDYGNLPSAGGPLFGWCKDMNAKFNCDLTKYISTQGQVAGYPRKWGEWNSEQVGSMVKLACAKLDELRGVEPDYQSKVSPNTQLNTPSTQKAEEFALKAQKDRLRSVINEWARMRGVATKEGCLALMDETGKACGRMIDSLDSETDSALLAKYIEYATLQATEAPPF